MSGHRRYSRWRSSDGSSSGSHSPSRRRSTRASTNETDDVDVPGGGHRRFKRPSSAASLPVRRRSPSSRRSWVLLNSVGAQLHERRDHTTSATSRTAKGDLITVSFELAEPPGTSVLTVDCPPAPTMTDYSPEVVAAHRDVVLLKMRYYEKDYFVYQVSSDPSGRRRRPSLLLLPSAGMPESFCSSIQDLGIMSCTCEEEDYSPSFVVAHLETGREINVHLFRSWSGQWQAFKNLHVRGANGGRELRWWSTDDVVPYRRRRCLIWVDYYRGMILMDMPSPSPEPEKKNGDPPPPRLRYVPLPVDRVGEDLKCGGARGCPKASRSVCVTDHGIKFVSIDSQTWTNFGIGQFSLREWSRRFRITTWSLREDDDYTWRKDATMHEEEFWNAFDRGNRLPRGKPEFPVVDMENPDAVVLQLKFNTGYGEQPWMIEVDLRKKVLLGSTAYSLETSLSSDEVEETINSVRARCHHDYIPSELTRYLDGGQACKKRRGNSIYPLTN